MASRTRMTLWLIDIAGGCLVVGCVSLFVWLSVVRRNHTTGEISELQYVVHAARRDLASLQNARDGQAGMLADRQEELVASGQLPDHPPVEEYFQMLSGLAAERRLKVLYQHPLSSRSYPGLLEQRYAYEVSGSMPDLARFLRDIEATKYWADVSYLKVDQGAASHPGSGGERVALLTISLFSAPPMEAPTDRG